MSDKEFIERLDFAGDRIKELEAENKRLREALKEIIDMKTPIGVGAEIGGWMKDLAEEALAALKEGGND